MKEILTPSIVKTNLDKWLKNAYISDYRGYVAIYVEWNNEAPIELRHYLHYSDSPMWICHDTLEYIVNVMMGKAYHATVDTKYKKMVWEDIGRQIFLHDKFFGKPWFKREERPIKNREEISVAEQIRIALEKGYGEGIVAQVEDVRDLPDKGVSYPIPEYIKKEIRKERVLKIAAFWLRTDAVSLKKWCTRPENWRDVLYVAIIYAGLAYGLIMVILWMIEKNA